MEDTANRAIAIVGAGAILPDAPNVAAFWENVKTGRYSITEVSPGPLGSRVLLRSRPGRSRQDLFEDRRMGARSGVGSDEVAPADSSARHRRDGPCAEVGDRGHAGSVGRLRLSQATARSGSRGRDSR